MFFVVFFHDKVISLCATLCKMLLFMQIRDEPCFAIVWQRAGLSMDMDLTGDFSTLFSATRRLRSRRIAIHDHQAEDRR